MWWKHGTWPPWKYWTRIRVCFSSSKPRALFWLACIGVLSNRVPLALVEMFANRNFACLKHLKDISFALLVGPRSKYFWCQCFDWRFVSVCEMFSCYYLTSGTIYIEVRIFEGGRMAYTYLAQSFPDITSYSLCYTKSRLQRMCSKSCSKTRGRICESGNFELTNIWLPQASRHKNLTLFPMHQTSKTNDTPALEEYDIMTRFNWWFTTVY
jgi:hypothetical protein